MNKTASKFIKHCRRVWHLLLRLRINRIFGAAIRKDKGSGSGSVIDTQGHILTNYHVIENAQKLTVSLGGDKVYPAKVVGGDPDTDLAVIKIEPPKEGLTVIPLSDSDNLSRRAKSFGNRQSVRFGQNFDDRRNFRFAASDSRPQQSSD